MRNWISSLLIVLCSGSIAGAENNDAGTAPFSSDRVLMANVSRLPADQSPMGIYLNEVPPAPDSANTIDRLREAHASNIRSGG